jgi:hypothetical protein
MEKKKSDTDPGLASQFQFSKSIETVFREPFKILKFFDVDPDPRSEIFLTPDPECKNSGPGSGMT